MNNLEVEIAELQKMIEAKRDQLEKEGGIIEEKELVRQSVREMFLDATTPATGTPTASAQTPLSATAGVMSGKEMPVDGSYLDYLDPETTETINQLIAEIPEKGISSIINEVSGKEPFVVDALHDALVDKLYDELKSRGLVK